MHLVQVAMRCRRSGSAFALLLILLGLAPLALAAVAAAGWVLTGRALAPVDAWSRRTRIGAEDLRNVAAENRDDELGRLAAVLNDAGTPRALVHRRTQLQRRRGAGCPRSRF